jgi:hypothetical protein
MFNTMTFTCGLEHRVQLRRRISSAKRTPAAGLSLNQRRTQGVNCNDLLCAPFNSDDSA